MPWHLPKVVKFFQIILMNESERKEENHSGKARNWFGNLYGSVHLFSKFH